MKTFQSDERFQRCLSPSHVSPSVLLRVFCLLIARRTFDAPALIFNASSILGALGLLMVRLLGFLFLV